MSKYTSSAPSRDEMNHPVGIINQVLGKGGFNKDGTTGTGALKVELSNGYPCRTRVAHNSTGNAPFGAQSSAFESPHIGLQDSLLYAPNGAFTIEL